MKRLLCVDGGGLRGLLPARLLEHAEQVNGKPIVDGFDLIAGTSTGGIIAIGLVAGLPASQLAELYSKRGAQIFSRSVEWEFESGAGHLKPKYQATALEAILLELLGNDRLSNGQDETVELLVTSYAMSQPKWPQSPYLFKSWKARAGSDRDFFLRDVARATSAAPTYFPPAQIRAIDGGQFLCIDGGVIANNPSAAALASARRLWPSDEFTIVSIGTGLTKPSQVSAESLGWGDVQWLKPILDIFMDGQMDMSVYEMREQLGSLYHRFETEIISIAMDDAGAIPQLEKIASAWVDEVGADLARTCARV